MYLGDGNLEWEEFISFTVERANVLNSRQKLASLSHYHDSSEDLDTSSRLRHRHDLSRAVVMGSLGQFAIVVRHLKQILDLS